MKDDTYQSPRDYAARFVRMCQDGNRTTFGEWHVFTTRIIEHLSASKREDFYDLIEEFNMHQSEMAATALLLYQESYWYDELCRVTEGE